MADIPDALLVHEVTLESVSGVTSAGDSLSAPRTVKCFQEDNVRLVRNAVGEEVVSSMTFYTKTNEVIGGSDRVTYNGKTGRVLSVLAHTDGGLGAWEHLEVVCE